MPCAHASFSFISLIQYVFCLYDGRVQLLPVQVPEILFWQFARKHAVMQM